MTLDHTPEDAAILARVDPTSASRCHDRFADANKMAVWADMRADYGRTDDDFLSMVIATAGYDYRDQLDLIATMRGAA